MEITGKFLKVGPLKTFESGFTVKEFYLDCSEFSRNTGEKIENLIKLQLTGSYTDIVDVYPIGTMLAVSFNIRGRVYKKEDGTKGHTQNLNAWKIQPVRVPNKQALVQQTQQIPVQQAPIHQAPTQTQAFDAYGNPPQTIPQGIKDVDDLPF